MKLKNLIHLYPNYYEDIITSTKVYRREFGFNTKKAAIRLCIKNFLYLLRPVRKRYSKKSQVILDKEKFSIAFTLAGGFGDYLLFANWLHFFRQKYPSEKIDFYVFYHIKSALSIFNRDDKRLHLIDVNTTPLYFANFDMVLKFIQTPKLNDIDTVRMKQLVPELKEYVCLLEKFGGEHYFVDSHHPLLEGLANQCEIAKSRKRIQQGDIYGFFGLTEDFAYKIPIGVDENEVLKKFNLFGKKIIMVLRGWNADDKGECSVKAWSLESCGDLIIQLKKNFPEYLVVVAGASRYQAPDTKDADMDLVAKTTMEEMKVLVKRVDLLISNEGGMVHLRHALHGGKSCVLFGPTSPHFYGYSENINLRSDVCPICCDWLIGDWQHHCLRNGNEDGYSECMKGIKTVDVINAIKTVL